MKERDENPWIPLVYVFGVTLAFLLLVGGLGFVATMVGG